MRDLVDLLKEMIPMHPVSADVSAVNAVTDRLHDIVRAEGLFHAVEDIGGRRVLYACTEETKTPEVLLNAHVDVVPAEEDQFEPYEQDGWLVGRGAADCLGNALLCARVLSRCRGRASVGAIFSADEEVGGGTTAGMVERGYGARGLILVLDGAAYAVAVAQKGVLTCVLQATGVSAHSSAPWLGENAIDRLIDGYVRIRELIPEVKAGDEWHDTVAATMISGGTAPNRIPDSASLTLNIRTTQPGGAEAWIRKLRDISGLEVSEAMTYPVVCFADDTPVFHELAEVMKQAFGRNIGMVKMNGATDARHFVDLQVPVAILGTPGRDIHGREEAAEIAALRAYEDMLTTFLCERRAE